MQQFYHFRNIKEKVQAGDIPVLMVYIENE